MEKENYLQFEVKKSNPNCIDDVIVPVYAENAFDFEEETIDENATWNRYQVVEVDCCESHRSFYIKIEDIDINFLKLAIKCKHRKESDLLLLKQKMELNSITSFEEESDSNLIELESNIDCLEERIDDIRNYVKENEK